MKNLLLNKDTRLIPIIGYPMGQSSASYAYNYLFEAYDKNAIMWPIEIARGSLQRFLHACETIKINRFTITMPHKSDIIPFLDEVDPSSKLFNSVNAVKQVDGIWHGVSCDGKGCIAAIQRKGYSLADKHVVMIGAGAISGVIGYELSRAKAKSLTILNRSVESALNVAKTLNEHTSLQTKAARLTAETLVDQAECAEVLLQCTPLGMNGYDDDYEDLSFVDRINNKCIIMETIVNPFSTSFVKKVKEKGMECIHGIDMLTAQLSEIFSFWFNEKVSFNDIKECKNLIMRHLDV